MKVSEMIKNLQKFMKDNGDLDCWYAVDDEGNGYQKVYYEPSLFYVGSNGEVYSNVKDLDDDGLSVEDVTRVCIVN